MRCYLSIYEGLDGGGGDFLGVVLFVKEGKFCVKVLDGAFSKVFIV